ncbi:MAG TPA: phenylalanine--tRNA ligase subunit beta [Gammaproteobacteria bacterium]|nr:phenylalanine--tRNA ligase subunit beta [Gammaproteobacteria bacterium]
MKISFNWLGEFVKIGIDTRQLADRLTLAGLEVSAIEPAHPGFRDVVVADVIDVKPHPDADKLRVCKVKAGEGVSLQIVCGASNVRAGMKAALIRVGGQLPDGTAIKRAKLRGIESEGMLCSARELGLSADASGLMELPADAPVGTALDAYLKLDDSIFEVELTPNRGDCLSLLGVARDVSALLDADLHQPDVSAVEAQHQSTLPITLEAPDACPRFLGRIIRGIDPAAKTPLWMQERLRRSGIRPISPLVDVTQYVMLELGQPMHAYDLGRVNQKIVVRWAKPGETLILLDGREIKLDPDMLVIADSADALGLAGIMGGEGSAVNGETRDVLLECAWFAPDAINGRGRRLALQTDAGYRFERGVDSEGQRRAMERATRLILEICGGEAGPVEEVNSKAHLPKRARVRLRHRRLERLLGMEIAEADVIRILRRLEMSPEAVSEGWGVTPPSHRFDIGIEEDLIEEVGRIYGYDRIPEAHFPMPQIMGGTSETRLDAAVLRRVLVARGYHEAITYSFVAPELQRTLSGGASGLALANPISAELAEMRLSLWPGLVTALQYNLNRQQERVRLFETGMRFVSQATDIKQETVIAGVSVGSRYPEQWGTPGRDADFADLKNDIEALLAAGGHVGNVRFEATAHPALHPGQSAQIWLNEEAVGWLGAIHPGIAQQLDIPPSLYLFEMALEPLMASNIPQFAPISRFPAIRRDIAVVVSESIAAETLVRVASSAAPELVRQVLLFDIYRGPGIDSGRKSVALGLILQDSSRTLTDDAADAAMVQVIERLRRELGATIRD